MRNPHVRREAHLVGGVPPARLVSHEDLMRELRLLLRVRGISERELERRDPQLHRSTVGAVLRGDCGARLEVVTAIVRVCGVDGEAARARTDAWARLSRPDLEQRRARGEAYARSLWPLYRWGVTGDGCGQAS